MAHRATSQRAEEEGVPQEAATASADLFPRIYQEFRQELRAIAQRHMNAERGGHTLEATALVNEVYLHLVDDPDVDWTDRAAFSFAAARAMRRILIEHARARRAARRGGGWRAVELSTLMELAQEADFEEIVASDDALLRFEGEAARAAAIVRLRFFSGLSIEEMAPALDISARTVNREFARAWLYQELAGRDLQVPDWDLP